MITLICNDIRRHSDQNIVYSWGAAEWVHNFPQVTKISQPKMHIKTDEGVWTCQTAEKIKEMLEMVRAEMSSIIIHFKPI